MTNERLQGVMIRLMLIPICLILTISGSYFLSDHVKEQWARYVLDRFEPVTATRFTAKATATGETDILYTYSVNGREYTGDRYSSIAFAHERARLRLSKVLLAETEAGNPPVIYYDPATPERSGLIHSYPTFGGGGQLGFGSLLTFGGLLGLYLLVRRQRRVEDLLMD